MHINTIDNSLLNIRTQLGAKWSVIVLLLPLLIFGTVHFGVRAGFVVSLSVVSCMVFGIIFRILKNDTYQLIHPGSIITGLLLGLTLRAETPVYMIIAGALVAEYIGKHLIVQMQQTLFNPAILGRTFVGILELLDPPLSHNPDMISSASVLAKESGGSVLPDFFDIFFGFTQGAIGETSPFLLLLVGGLLLRYIVLKREAAITMILTVLLMVVILPPSPEIVGHAPWFQNPLIYLFGGSTLFCAIFFASDPATIPNTRWGCIIFGMGAGMLGVLGKFYTSIQGVEMYGILMMNVTVPFLNHIFQGKKAAAPNMTPLPLPDSLTHKLTKTSLSERYGIHSFYTAPATVRSPKPEYPQGFQVPHFKNYPHDFSIFKQKLDRNEILDKIKRLDFKGCGGAHFPVFAKWTALKGTQHPRILIINGLEGEPQSFKDCYLMQNHALMVVEGAAIAAYTTAIDHIYIVINAHYHTAYQSMTEAVDSFTQAFAEQLSFTIEIVKGPDPEIYVCGEETALIQYLQSKRAEPQLRPPFPTTAGLWGQATLIHNVETVSWLPIMLDPAWNSPVPKLISLSGAVKHVGVYEVIPGQISLGEILKLGGGTEQLLAFFVAGSFLPPSCSKISYQQDSLSQAGAVVGSGAIQILSETSNILEEALQHARFFRDESCGRCTPCRVGTREIVRLWENIIQGTAHKDDVTLLLDISNTIQISSSCGLGIAAPQSILSVLRYWNLEKQLERAQS